MYSLKKSFAAVALSGIFAVASFAQSEPGRAAGRSAEARPHADRLAVLIKALNLSDAQVTSIRSTMQNERPALKAAFQDVKAKREALKTASSAANPNPAAVGSAFLALRSSQANLKADRQKLQAAIANVLTPDQQKSMKALRVVAQSRHPRFRRFGEGSMSMGS
jgi:Spy/CpxP family protein refolding chaperone